MRRLSPTVWPVESSRRNLAAPAPHHLHELKGFGMFDKILLSLVIMPEVPFEPNHAAAAAAASAAAAAAAIIAESDA